MMHPTGIININWGYGFGALNFSTHANQRTIEVIDISFPFQSETKPMNLLYDNGLHGTLEFK